MPRKLFRKYLPSHQAITQNRWTAWCKPWLGHHNLWHLHRRSVAGGVAVGMFAGLIPGPLQVITAIILSIMFRVNLPVAALTTLYTNPLTIVPLYYVAYRLGALVTLTDINHHEPVTFSMADKGWTDWIPATIDWMISLGKPLAVGLPLLAVILAALGYLLVDQAWRIHVRLTWQRRGKRRNNEDRR